MKRISQITNGLDCVLIAAGNSSRLGEPKQWIQYGEESLLNRQLKLAGQLFESPVCVLGFNAQAMRKSIQADGINIVDNIRWAEGMGTSIACGVQQLSKSCSAVLIFLCDQWAIKPSDLSKLIDCWHREPQRIVASRYFDHKRQQVVFGAPAIFPRHYFSQLAELTRTGARTILNQNIENVIAVKLANAAFDIDTPEDLQYFYSKINDLKDRAAAERQTVKN